MNTIPLAVALIPLVLFLTIFVLFSAINLYHILRYGEHNTGKFVLIATYVAGTLFLTGGSFLFLSEYDWNQPLLQGSDIPFERILPFFTLPSSESPTSL